MIRSYLQVDSQYADRFSDVWLWQDWPGRNGKVDTGIDLVAREHDSGALAAIQCKFYDPATTLSRQFNDMIYQLPSMFPSRESANIGFYLTGIGAQKPFSVLVVDSIPDLNLWGSEGGRFFSRYTYLPRMKPEDDLFSQLLPVPVADTDSGSERVDNITDWALADYRASYGPSVTKDDIFHFVYGLLHSPSYRTDFAADLKKVLPRIPKLADAADFRAFSKAGRELAGLHIGYEEVEPFPLDEIVTGPVDFRLKKMAFGKNKDRSRIIYNEHITLTGIPEDAYDYMLGSRSAVEWIMDRYQVKTDKASGIANDPNDWCDEVGDPRYIIDLVKRIVTVSVETNRIVAGLPALAMKNEPI